MIKNTIQKTKKAVFVQWRKISKSAERVKNTGPGWEYNLPWQFWVLQSSSWCVSPRPVQSFPPYCGEGFVHVFVRFLVPVPQSLEHVPHALHSDNPPSTKEIGETQSWEGIRGCFLYLHVVRTLSPFKALLLQADWLRCSFRHSFNYVMIGGGNCVQSVLFLVIILIKTIIV